MAASVRIRYRTSPDASALQWLEPSQTTGAPSWQMPVRVSQDSCPLHARPSSHCASLVQHPVTNPARVQRVVGTPQHLAVAQQAAERSITLIRNSAGLLPQVEEALAQVEE